MNNTKILIIDEAHHSLIDKLTISGFVCDYIPGLSKLELMNILDKYFGMIVRSKIIVDKEIIDKGINLKFIAREGAGLDGIDVDYLKEKGIMCINSPEGNRDALGEHAIGMLLSLFNNICRANSEVKKGKWYREANRGIELKGKTIGIIGYGNMGSAFAKRLQGFDVKVLAYDKYKTGFSDEYVREVTMDKLFEKTDILSVHVPLTEETTYLINNQLIEQFHKNIFILNTARGKVLKTTDLVDNLKSGKVLGAVLDVIEYEKSDSDIIPKKEFPAVFNYLKKAENVILTPHIGGWTHESKIKLSEVLADKIIEAFEHLVRNK